jgi:hypothetical protein
LSKSLENKLDNGNLFIKYTDYSLFRKLARAEDIADNTGQPLFRVRSSLREFKDAGFVEEAEDRYRLSKTGEIAIQKSSANWPSNEIIGDHVIGPPANNA